MPMKKAEAQAVAQTSAEKVLPDPLGRRVAHRVADAVRPLKRT